jgi:UPF0755 protein
MFKKIGLLLIVVGGIAAFVFKNEIGALLYSSGITTNKTTVDFYIKNAVTLEELADELVTKGVIEKKTAVLYLGNYKNLNENNIAVGRYLIAPSTSVRQILNGFKLNSLGNGNAEVEVEIVIPNSRFLEDVVARACEYIIADSANVVDTLFSTAFLQANNLTPETLPSIFVPDTYRLFYDSDAKNLVDRIMLEYSRFWNSSRIDKMEKSGLKSIDEVVTLASVVYSEQSKNNGEWPVIAGLYLNRINRGIPLQSDPTFKFCWGKKLDNVQRLLTIHSQIDCKYNTYLYKGLPPGPICVPPVACIDAVLNADKNKYIFMVAEPSYDGKHVFTTNYNDHLKHARIFQRWISQQ